jgi:transposase
VVNKFKMSKHFIVDITDDSITYRRDEDKIAAEASLDGIYVLRTSLDNKVLDGAEVVSSYKSLAYVERVFRGFNTDLDIRPIRHRTEERVRTHVFLRMLSYYVSFHMQRTLAPMLFKDDDPEGAVAKRTSPVAPAERSTRAIAKTQTKRTADNDPVHSFATLLKDLATVTANRVQPIAEELPPFTMITMPTPIQRRAFELLGISHRLGYA